MTNDLVEKLRALHVWPQIVADDHADLLTPRRIDKLYEVGRVSHEAADLIETQAREIERLRGALREVLDHARHADDCAIYHRTRRPCSCGFEVDDEAARAALAGDSHV